MTDEEKSLAIAMSFVSPDTKHLIANKILMLQIEDACQRIALWKEEQLNSAIDKALERNGDFLKAGKITQYGYDIAFATIQNIRECLK